MTLPRVMYLVAPSVEAGVLTARGRGWARLASGRFATAERSDVRLVCRFADLIPFSGVTPMVKGHGYDDPPDAWVGEWELFEEFAASGKGEWI